MKVSPKIVKAAALAAVVAGLAFYFQNDLRTAFNNFNRRFFPCAAPLTYSLGRLDPEFNLSRADLLKAAEQAAIIWQTPIKKDLFGYAPPGRLKINLIYDERQQSTDKLKSLGLIISDDQASYENLKAKYDSFGRIYEEDEDELNKIIGHYNRRKADYEAEVRAANARGGALPAEYAILEQARAELYNLAQSVKVKQDALNKTADDLNALARAVNKLIRELNLKVGDYNTVGEQAAGEFQEGRYVNDASGERIDIYQFDNFQALVRVLAHELGHALGLEHVDDPAAIMYRLNESGNDRPTADDLAELKAVCRLDG